LINQDLEILKLEYWIIHNFTGLYFCQKASFYLIACYSNGMRWIFLAVAESRRRDNWFERSAVEDESLFHLLHRKYFFTVMQRRPNLC